MVNGMRGMEIGGDRRCAALHGRAEQPHEVSQHEITELAMLDLRDGAMGFCSTRPDPGSAEVPDAVPHLGPHSGQGKQITPGHTTCGQFQRRLKLITASALDCRRNRNLLTGPSLQRLPF